MNEIHSTSESNSSFEIEPSFDLPPFWKKGGRSAFYGFGAIAAGAFTPSYPQRKRRMTIGPVASPSLIAQPQIEINLPEANTTQDQSLLTSSETSNSPVSLATQSSNPTISLHCSDAEKEHIQVIFTTMGGNYWNLLNRSIELNERGKAIAHLHPLQFLSVILSDLQLQKHLKVVMESTFLRPSFLANLEKNLNAESEKNNIIPHIEAFARRTSVSADEIKPLIQRRAWEQLVSHLIEKTDEPRAQSSLA